jgi:endonuclease/exonuclease/phosphatase (EEP) superfamily protein YafD
VIRLILLLGTGGLIVATGFALAARHWWLFDLFSHFRLQYLFVALILLPLALLLRAWPAAILLLAVGLIHGYALEQLWLGGERAATGRPLRVVSVNVLARNETAERVLAFVRAADADLAILVDAQGERWHDVLENLGQIYPHRAPAKWQDGAPVILFSRHPIDRQELIEPVDGYRPYLLAEIGVGDGIPTLVAAVHPTSPKPDEPGDSQVRNVQLDHIAKSLQGVDGPVIVAGDLNTTPFSPHFRDLMAAADLRHAAAGHGYVGTWPVRWWPLRIPIDHLLIKGPVSVHAFGRGSEVGSDHFPIVADLRLLAPEPAEAQQ